MVTLILEGIIYGISCILFYAEAGLGYIIDLLYDIFEVFVGAKPIMASGEETFILDLFFNNSLVSTLYWGMAVIGFALSFGFAVIAVVKKIFDMTGEKVKATYGQILFNLGKSILLIVLMTSLVSATITASGVLMDQVAYLFDNAEELSDPTEIVFTDEQFASMFRIIDTISNHGLNSSFDNRFNINSCYNEVRSDLYQLAKAGVFNYDYAGCEDSWQYALYQLYLSSDVTSDIPVDVVNDAVSSAILFIMDQAKNTADFKPLASFSRGYSYSNLTSKFGRIMMLVGSFGAARNSAYDGDDAGFKDDIRNQFFVGTKSIYDKGDVESYFSIWIGEWRHLTVLLCEAILIIEFVKMIFNCVARIFNIILLYIISPGFIAAMPLDDGGKLKQWTTAFVIQTLSIFGTFISVRLITVFVPIIMNSSVILFDSGFKNVVAKILFVLGICLTAQKSSAMISGILADNAGYQSIMAGNVGDTGLGMVGKAVGFTAKTGLKLGVKAASAAASAGKSLAGKLGGAMASLMGSGGGGGGATKTVRSNANKGATPSPNSNKGAQPNGSTPGGTPPGGTPPGSPINKQGVPEKLGPGNGDQDAFKESQETNTFQPGSINSHIKDGDTAGGFKLGDFKKPLKPSASSVTKENESNPIDNTGGKGISTGKGTVSNTPQGFEAGTLNSHISEGAPTQGGFKLGQPKPKPIPQSKFERFKNYFKRG